MKRRSEPGGKEQRLLRNARREGLLIMVVWLIALVWSTVIGYLLGYRRPAQEIRLIFGMPDWVLFAVALPWAICFAFSFWFCFFYMADDDLGEDRYEDPGHG